MIRCLSVSCVAHDGFLEDVHAHLGAVTIVRDDAELGARLEGLAADGCSVHTLDLISHSYPPHHLLKLGRWRIERGPRLEQFIARAREPVKRLQIARLRLLACLTAFSPAGREALGDLQAGFEGVEVYGAIDIVRASSFGRDGFSAAEEFRLVRP